MKKKQLIFILIIICIPFLFIKFFVFGYVEYNYNNGGFSLKIPSFSFISSEKKDELVFKSLKSILSLKNDVDKIYSTFDKYLCNNNYYYYDRENDITILNYKVDLSIIFNNITIKYKVGKYDSNYCNKIYNYLKTNYKFLEYPETATGADSYSFSITKNEENITVHYNILNGMIHFKNGQDKYIDLISILKYKWIDIYDIEKLFEYQFINKKIEKKVYEDNTIMYKTEFFNYINCNNNNYYFVSTTQDNSVCK